MNLSPALSTALRGAFVAGALTIALGATAALADDTHGRGHDNAVSAVDVATATPSPSPSASATASPTSTGTVTASVTATSTVSGTATPAASATPSATPAPDEANGGEASLDVRHGASGEVTKAGGSSLVIETEQGALTVLIGADTEIRGQGQSDLDTTDIKIGMRVSVQGELSDDGLMARQIVVHPSHDADDDGEAVQVATQSAGTDADEDGGRGRGRGRSGR